MERRDFIVASGLLAALGAAGPSGAPSFAAAQGAAGAIEPVLLPPQPPLDHNGGMEIRVWVRQGMTNGVYSNVECAVAPKVMGPPPHYHRELDELMYVAEGTAGVLVGKEIVHVESGGWHLRPRMIKHTFWNASDKPLRFYDMYFHQPFEEYLEQVFYGLTAANGYPDGSEKKNKALLALNDRFGVVFPEDSSGERNDIVRRFGLR